MKRSPMKPRTKRMERSPMKRKKRSAAEQAAKFEREYGGEAKRNFVASLPCLVTGCPNPSEAAHVVNIDAGMGRKGSHLGLAPCCPFHHRDPVHGLHKLGPRTFERLHHVSLAACAERTEALWQREVAA